MAATSRNHLCSAPPSNGDCPQGLAGVHAQHNDCTSAEFLWTELLDTLRLKQPRAPCFAKDVRSSWKGLKTTGTSYSQPGGG